MRDCVGTTQRKPKPNKSGHSLVPLSAHILPYGFSMPCKRQALISSLPPHPHRARFYRCVSILFFDFYVWLCLTSFTAVHFICGLALSLRVHSFVLLIFEYISFHIVRAETTQRKPNLIKQIFSLPP